ncbi:MAG: ClbS/DfsB family four-helix bundle protein [Ktedonobacteraceae bacterium]
MDKTTFIDTLVQIRAQWDALIAQIDEQWMLEPGVEGDWSIKDIIAHVMWNELEMIPLIQTRTLTGSELWDLPQDERNAAVYQQYRDHPLPEILSQEQQAYTQLLAQAKTLSDEELNDPHRFKNMPDTEDWIPWRIIAGCSFTHYPDHMASIREWLIRRGGGG